MTKYAYDGKDLFLNYFEKKKCSFLPKTNHVVRYQNTISNYIEIKHFLFTKQTVTYTYLDINISLEL